LPGADAALWRRGADDCSHAVRCGRWVQGDAADGGCRSGAPARPPPSGAARRTPLRLGPTLPARRLRPPDAAQPFLPDSLFHACAAAADRSAVPMIRRHLVLFVRAPLLGTGKRRLARDIGAVAALRFERAMLTLLVRRLRHDG